MGKLHFTVCTTPLRLRRYNIYTIVPLAQRVSMATRQPGARSRKNIRVKLSWGSFLASPEGATYKCIGMFSFMEDTDISYRIYETTGTGEKNIEGPGQTLGVIWAILTVIYIQHILYISVLIGKGGRD